MAKNQVIEVSNVIELQDKTGELEFNLKQLKAVKNEIINLVLDLDNESADGWSGNSALLAIQLVEDKLTLLNLAITSIYDQMNTTTKEISNAANELFDKLQTKEVKIQAIS